GDLAGIGFLTLLEDLAVSGMQDYVTAENVGFFNISKDPTTAKLHSITTDVFWQDPEFIAFKTRLLEEMAVATAPEQNVLQAVMPGLSTDIRALTSEVSLSSNRVF
ncbi:UNVERIFIED_CONTAM: hypothetical protein HDU68_003554, partial [Siphonaria sp. JEL0065]